MLFTEGMTVESRSEIKKVFVALIASVCDLLATAKLGGFLSCSSQHGCWKCSKYFPRREELKVTVLSLINSVGAQV